MVYTLMSLASCKIICFVPTLNESITVTEVIRKAKPFVHQVVVIDGHSRDDTVELASQTGVDVIYQEGTGKGMAVRTGLDKYFADIYVTIDGDATYDALEMNKLIQPLINDEADMVIGSRLQGNMEEGSISRINTLGNKLFNALINVLFRGQITDSQSGFRAFTRKVVDACSLSAEGFEIETELTIQALKHGLRVLDVPITYGRRRGTPSKLSALKDGFRIFKTIIRCSLFNSLVASRGDDQ